MAKHRTKTVTHLPAAPPPAPRLAAQLLVAMGELLAVGVCVVGIVTVAGWVIAGAEPRSKSVKPPSREIWRCWYDRRYGAEICQPPYRLPPSRRYWT
jgi:hypothetical protein